MISLGTMELTIELEVVDAELEIGIANFPSAPPSPDAGAYLQLAPLS